MDERSQKALTALGWATTVAMLIFAPYTLTYAMMIKASKGAGNYLGYKMYMRKLKKETKNYTPLRPEQDADLAENKIRIVGSLEDELQSFDDNYILVKRGGRYSFLEVEKKKDELYGLLEEITDKFYREAGDPNAIGILTKDYLLEYIRHSNINNKREILNNIDDILDLYEGEDMIERVVHDGTEYIRAIGRDGKSLINDNNGFRIVEDGIYTHSGENIKVETPNRRFIVPEGKLEEVRQWLNEKFEGNVRTQDGVVPIDDVEEGDIVYLPPRLMLNIEKNKLFEDAEEEEEEAN